MPKKKTEQNKIFDPPKITVSTIEELNQKLDEGLEEINSGNVVPAEVVNQRLHEKYGIRTH